MVTVDDGERQPPVAAFDDEATATASLQSVTGDRNDDVEVPMLTILYHPDVSRVGQRARLSALLQGETVGLSRHAPLFQHPGDPASSAPLGHRRISRQLHRLSRLPGGALVLTPAEATAPLLVDGERVPAHGAIYDAARLQVGVVLELSDRVVLLLHGQRRGERSRPPRFGMIGDSPAVNRLRGQIEQLRDVDVPVLLRGESGTGKELAARGIHETSARRARPFVSINIATVPTSVAASELFGHVRGAFTGAEADRIGLFRRADGGTLLLDEIGEAPGDVQVALLRVIETGEVLPVGGHRSYHVDVRLIAATDADLERRVSEGMFRSALLHRLGGYQIHIPPLRERPDDIGRLLVHFLEQELDAVGEPERLAAGADEPWLPARLVARLCRYDWPGNVRQLRNVVRQLVISNRGRDRFETPPIVEKLMVPSRRPLASDLPPPELAVRHRRTSSRPPRASERPRLRPGQIDDEALVAALAANGWRFGPTARQLGISRNTLLALVDRSELVRRPKDLSREDISLCHDEHDGDLARMATALRVSERGLKLRMGELEMAEPAANRSAVD